MLTTATLRRIVLAGDIITVELPADKLLPVAGAEDFKIVFEANPNKIKLRTNTTSSSWMDVEEG